MGRTKDDTNWGCWAAGIIVAAIVLGPTILGIIGLIQSLGFFLGPAIVLALIALTILGIVRGLKYVKSHALYPLVSMKVRKATRTETLFAGSLKKDARSVEMLLKQNEQEPLVKALGPGIRKMSRTFCGGHHRS